MPGALEPLKIRTHPRRRPVRIAGQIPNVIPVRVMRVDQDHGVVRGAPPPRARSRIEDAALGRPVVWVAPLFRFIFVVPDEEIPFHGGVFGSESMKGGNVVVRRKAVGLGVDGIAAAQLPRIAPSFQHNNAATTIGQARSHGAPART